jgi:hypothetical protein
MAVAAPPVARSTARSGASAARAAKKRDAPGPPARAKLKVGAANDPLERDADAAADKVMRAPVASFPMAGPEKPSPKDDKVRRKTEKAKDTTDATVRRATTPKDKGAAGKKQDPARRAAKPESKAKPAKGGKNAAAQRAAKPAKESEQKKPTAQRAAKPGSKAKPDQEAQKTPARRATKPGKESAPKKPTARRAGKPGGEREAEKSREQTARRDPAGAADAGAGEPPAGFEAALGRVQQGGGAPLPEPTRRAMESGYGRSFDNVRMHTDGGAASAAESIQARAFTVGNNVYFGAGQYQPQTSGGRQLIAHELAHVVQQSSGLAQPSVQRAGTTDTTKPVEASGPADPASLTPPQEPKKPPEFPGKNGRIVRQDDGGSTKGTFYLPTLSVPFIAGGPKGASNHPVEDLKGVPAKGGTELKAGAGFTLPPKTPRGSQTARQTWIKLAQADTDLQNSLKGVISDKFANRAPPAAAEGTEKPGSKAAEGEPAPVAAGSDPYYYLQPIAKDQAFFIIGSAQELAAHDLVVAPTWNDKGLQQFFHIDHWWELQLGGLDGWKNYVLLDQTANQSSGSIINSRMIKAVDTLLKEATTGKFWTDDKGGPAPANVDEVFGQWAIHFNDLAPVSIKGGDNPALWTRSEILAGKHLGSLKAMSDKEIAAAGLSLKGGRPKVVNVFSNPLGGYFKQIKPAGKSWTVSAPPIFGGFTVASIEPQEFETVQDGQLAFTLKGEAFRKASKNGTLFPPIPVDVPLLQSRRLGFGVYADKSALNKALHALNQMKGASPVVIDDAGIDDTGAKGGGGLFVEGRIIASLPLFKGMEIPFNIYGDNLTVDFALPLAGLHIGPIEVTDSTLQIGAGASGLSLTGSLGFLLKGVGSGRLQATAAAPTQAAPAGGGAPAAEGETPSEPGFSFTGSFDFDSDIFEPASITVGYSNHQFTVDAPIGLKPGSIRGIESALIHIRSGPEGVLVEGMAILGIPSLQGTQLAIRRSETGEIAIGADNIPLPVDRIPGVSSATANIHAVRNPDTGEWSVSGGGTAGIAIAGVSGDVTLALAGPFVTIRGDNITISRPPLTGSGAFLVSNQPRDPAGNPIEGEPTDMVASGQVEASLPLGKYLRGTIGGIILPNGELLFTGGVSLPSSVDLFERQAYERVLFRPPSLDIPIFGVAAAGQRIGIFATIGGSLTFTAGIGPGQIRDAALFAVFNPDRPEETEVHGGAKFVVPADAGLRLAINGGIGAGIPVVSAEAGIEIGASLGLVAEASAEVGVDWTPSDGLSLSATASLNAQPQFTFDISAYLRITADVVIAEFDLYDERWELASFSFGPELAVGVDVPISWTEQNGLDFDVNQIDVRYPEIDFQALGSDLIANLVSE